jgi:hypothetical protein
MEAEGRKGTDIERESKEREGKGRGGKKWEGK